MPIVFRTREYLTIAQLTHAWGCELAKEHREDPVQSVANLEHILLEDIVNGRLDDAGPSRDGRRLGMAWITADNKAGFIEGRFFLPLIGTELTRNSVRNNVIVMKEAALDFARRRKLSPPTWWREEGGVSPGATTAGVDLNTASPPPISIAEARQRGRRPEKRARVEAAMKRDIQEGRQTLEGLKSMPQKVLAATYSVSRETARKSLTAVESEMSPGNQPRQ
jgi:hypothetical protein